MFLPPPGSKLYFATRRGERAHCQTPFTAQLISVLVNIIPKSGGAWRENNSENKGGCIEKKFVPRAGGKFCAHADKNSLGNSAKENPCKHGKL
jgi:hypothetical protein